MILKKTSLLLAALLFVASAFAQQSKVENVIIITLDGMRWQEVFYGVDSSLMNNPEYNRDVKGMQAGFWHDDPAIRRH